jgi:hypothetical protein
VLDRLLTFISGIPDHIQALAIIALGTALSCTKHPDTGQALIAAGLTMWRGQPTK